MCTESHASLNDESIDYLRKNKKVKLIKKSTFMLNLCKNKNLA
jgi:hypothetical protein